MNIDEIKARFERSKTNPLCRLNTEIYLRDIEVLLAELERLQAQIVLGVIDSDVIKSYDGSALERADKYIEQLEEELKCVKQQLATTQQQLDKAVDDMASIANAIENCADYLSGDEDRVNSLHLGRCDVCKKSCHNDTGCKFEWRGQKERE